VVFQVLLFLQTPSPLLSDLPVTMILLLLANGTLVARSVAGCAGTGTRGVVEVGYSSSLGSCSFKGIGIILAVISGQCGLVAEDGLVKSAQASSGVR
jgi:hypothetical protein